MNNKFKNNNRSSYAASNIGTFDGNLIKEKLISNKFKKFFILKIISIIQIVLSLSSVIASGMYLSQSLGVKAKILSQIKEGYNESGFHDLYHQMVTFNIPICAVFLAIGLVLLIENFTLIPILCYSIVRSEKQNFEFILKKCNSSYLKANVRFFLTTESKFNIIWYCTWFTFIGIPYNIYQGLKYTYNHTKNTQHPKTSDNNPSDNSNNNGNLLEETAENKNEEK